MLATIKTVVIPLVFGFFAVEAFKWAMIVHQRSASHDIELEHVGPEDRAMTPALEANRADRHQQKLDRIKSIGRGYDDFREKMLDNHSKLDTMEI